MEEFCIEFASLGDKTGTFSSVSNKYFYKNFL